MPDSPKSVNIMIQNACHTQWIFCVRRISSHCQRNLVILLHTETEEVRINIHTTTYSNTAKTRKHLLTFPLRDTCLHPNSGIILVNVLLFFFLEIRSFFYFLHFWGGIVIPLLTGDVNQTLGDPTHQPIKYSNTTQNV